MCGIHLVLDSKSSFEKDSPEILQHMLRASKQRGPDSQTVVSSRWDEGQLHLAANRLKIIDPHQRADQPMRSADGRYILCFNGMLYNYSELRNELLGEGVQFSTQSDTEVLLHMLIQRGSEALNRLNGMFALFFYDTRAEKLLIARDRFGMKPLYYFRDDTLMVSASETRAILQSGLVQKKLRTAAIAEYLTYRYVLPPFTFFENILQFPAGHFAEVNPGAGWTIKPFTRQIQTEALPEERVVEDVEELLTDAVLRHLQADVSSGLFLSGGVDSTLLLALIQEQGAHPVPTFSVANSQQDAAYGTQDFKYAAKAAAMYGMKHYELPLSAAMLPEYAPDFVGSLDQPVGDSAAFLTYLLSAEVKKVAGIALSGAGADELFGGYHRHQAYHWYLKNYSLFLKTGGLFKNMTRLLPVGFSHPLRKEFRLLRKLGQSLHQNPATTFQHFITTDTLADARHFEKAISVPTAEPEEFEEYWLRYALEHDLGHYLAQDVLILSDTMSMAQSLEMRMPYLDLDLADYVQRLPAAMRLKYGRKWILRRLLDKRGGKLFTQRSKEGFGLPLGSWWRTEEMHEMRSTLQDRNNILYQHIPFQKVQKMLQWHQQKRYDYGLDLWNLWQLAAWLKLHFA
jgi:asparagine synthase (glutamine-hydrolysing)